jgi:hypothetical protein
MAELPSSEDDPRRAFPGRPDNVIGLVSETLGDDKRTDNAIRLFWSVAMPAALVFYAFVVAVKGMHGLENPATWIPGGLFGGRYLIKLVVWIKRRRGSGSVSGAVGTRQTIPRAPEQSRRPVPREPTPRRAPQPRRQSGQPPRKRRS